ncbi:MAG: hypothetical protein HWE27_12715 [Gammaproteobacteria bacterium]|nr:hypothetical protein [Gammaproteobacteria bacterium]
MKIRIISVTALIMSYLAPIKAESEVDFSAVTGLEARLFAETATFGQDDAGGSVYSELEWYFKFENSSVTLKPFFRYDSMDDNRTHVDLREAYWQTVGDEWSLTVGVNKVFWGVAETSHLVDIINQTDAVENIDGEDKLGQPMLNFNLEKSWGTLAFYILPKFRERTFASDEGRLRLELVVNDEIANYESSDEDEHIDFAVRYSTFVDVWDIGFSYFNGTSRDPLFEVDFLNSELIPFYPLIEQVGIDAQATVDEWLWKLEYINRSGFNLPGSTSSSYSAAVFGFEYSSYGVFDSPMDLGWIFEYQYDERDAFGSGSFNIDISDVIVAGARLTFNDVQSTSLLTGLGYETDGDATFLSIEGSRRIGDDMKLSVEGRVFHNISKDFAETFFFSYRNDSFIQINFEKFF